MSTISSTTSAAFTPPKQRLLNAIASKAETGQISATDKTALDSAVATIDGSVAGGSGSSQSARLDPSQMKSRVDGLIGDAVSNGTLTDDQAATLKDLFSQGGAQGGGEGGGKVGGAGGPPPGPPPAGGPPPSASDDGASDDSSTSATSTDATRVSDLLTTFMKQLQATQGQGGAYTAGGSGSGSRIASALLVNFEA
ncbi:hypothetical protein [Methylobacterium sp. J-090]|uniref:hypothetical protein n=1 Tax=Methylobacterium sp. J-090 TaxID=2836666 RepID=UPI001FB9BA92|nr:hypothetical protein [Methylobacterium sp. J-090]MCJ2080346.1 hypothetical protein [Methylobacterium sp. J-090]